MLARSCSIVLALFILGGCGDKTEVKVSDAKPASQSADAGKPVTGDWLVTHSSSDPEQLNPLTSNDATASEILLNYIFQTLLTRDPRTLELKPLLAESRPEISKDKLTYTFKIRRDVYFQDGRPLTGEDVLFSIKAIKCSLVNAPFLRVYFDSVVDAQLVDNYTIRFVTKEPYFLNESVLGENITIMPRHYYDPENLLKNFGVRNMLGDPAKLPEDVKKFADNFNKNYSRNPMGTGPFKLVRWTTGREVELVRNSNYWGNGKSDMDQVYLDRVRYRIINNPDAALVTLKSGGLDMYENVTPIQTVPGPKKARL